MAKIRLLNSLPALKQGEEIQLQLEVTGLGSSIPFFELECTVDSADEVLVNGHAESSTNGAAVENGRALIGFTLLPRANGSATIHVRDPMRIAWPKIFKTAWFRWPRPRIPEIPRLPKLPIAAAAAALILVPIGIDQQSRWSLGCLSLDSNKEKSDELAKAESTPQPQASIPTNAAPPLAAAPAPTPATAAAPVAIQQPCPEWVKSSSFQAPVDGVSRWHMRCADGRAFRCSTMSQVVPLPDGGEQRQLKGCLEPVDDPADDSYVENGP